MGKYINFGKYNKNYIYIILVIIFMILKSYLPIILIEIFLHKEIEKKNILYLFKHDYILDVFRFFVMSVFSYICYIYEKRSSRSESNFGKSNDLNSEKGCFKDVKNNDEKIKYNNRKIFLNLNILITITICTIIESLYDIFSSLSIFSDWMIFLLIMSYINSKMFKHVTYRHHKFAIYFNFITAFIFQLSTFILIVKFKETIPENKNKNIFINYLKFWFWPLGFIILFIYVYICSYTYTKMKWFMDLKQFPLTKLFIIYALLGFIINIILCLLLTYIKCGREIGKYFCNILDKKNDLYLENIFVFFYKISKIYEENKNYLIFIIFIFFVDAILYSMSNLYYLLILKYLTPEFYVFTDSIIGIFNEIIEILTNKIIEGYYFGEDGKDNKILLINFILKSFGNFLGFIGFLVYSEIIELNFCGLSYNLRRKIIERSIEDSIEKICCNEDQNESLFDLNLSNINAELSNNLVD